MEGDLGVIFNFNLIELHFECLVAGLGISDRIMKIR
jgi:hypothetical protein